MHRRYWIVIFVLSVLLGIIIADNFFLKKGEPGMQTGNTGNAFVGDKTCQSCHAAEYNDWLKSDHFMAMQPANDSTVKGDFNNTVFSADGVTSRFFKRNGRFYINTQGEDGQNQDFEIKYTFGHTPLQQYLVEFPGGRMQVTRASWDTQKKKWFHQYKGQKIPAGDWLHWTGNAQNWNTMCADCHSTDLKKNYTIESDTYHTTFEAVNVSCEACHGPGKNHISYINGSYKKGEKIAGSKLQLPKNASQSALIYTCAPCHSRRTIVSNNNRITSAELLDNYITDIPSEENFHADGQVDEESFIHTSFLQSKMYQVGVTCNNCHNPHSGKLVLKANNVCMQCHGPKYNEPGHTFHAVNTAGSQCISCHMPGKYFMGNDYRHDHSLRVPRPDLSVAYGTPNACNNCHTDKSAKWAADAVNKWYGPSRKYHFAEDLIRGSKAGPEAEAYLLKLLNKKEVPDIVKATAASYLGNTVTPGSLQGLLSCLSADDAQIRYRALRSLMNFQPDGWMDVAAPLLRDKVRAVRVAAADLFLSIPPGQLPPNYTTALAAVKNELQDYLYSQADFASGNISLGDYYLRLQDNVNAEKFYIRGLKKDSLLNYARLNLSIAYNLQGKNEQALQVLKTAEKVDPKNDAVYYNIALLYHEMNDTGNALAAFEKAVQLNSANPRVYYNYGLLLLKSGTPAKAETVLLKGLKQSPQDISVNYALAYFYLQQNQPLKAQKPALLLKQADPGNPEYAWIFSALKL